jgi:CHAT domain-containing protein
VSRARGHPELIHSQPGHSPAGTEVADDSGLVGITDLSSEQQRAEFIDQHPELMQPAVVSNLAVLVPQLVKSDRSKALAVAEAAVMIADRLGDAESIAQSLRAKANAHYALGQNKIALEHHAKALRLFRSLGHDEQVARTLSSSIQPLILQSRYQQAFAAAREARKIFTKQGNQWRVARLDLNLGNILDRQDRLAQALRCYEHAYQYLSTHAEEDPEGVAVALHNMAVLYMRRNDFRAAETAYEKARGFAVAHDMPVLVGQADYNIAALHYLRGDYSLAISMLCAARETCRSTGDEYHVALCHLDLSEIYLELNLIAEAAEAAEQASASFGELGMQYEKAKSIANLAAATSQQGNAARALELFLQARRIFVQEKNKVLPAIIDLNRAAVLSDEKRDGEARRLGTVALHALQHYKLTNKAIVCRLLLARLELRRQSVRQNNARQNQRRRKHSRQKNFRAAQQQCGRALKALASFELPVLSCQAYALQGQILAAAGHDRRAYEAYERARTYLDSLRNRIHAEELKISFMKDRVEIYEGLVALCMKGASNRDASAEIFRYIEQAKSRTLFDFLSASQSPFSLAPQDQTDDARRIRELREELNWFFHMTEMAQLKQASRHELSVLRAEARRRERELLKLSRERVSADDRQGAAQLASTFTVDQVRQSLPADAAILEYFQVQGQMVVLLLTADRLQMVPLGELSRISTAMDLLQLQLSKLRLGFEYVKSFAGILLKTTQSHLQELYKLLIEPILNLILNPIRGASAGRHLIVAPHGILHQLPFQALFDGNRYLIDEFTVSYAPSASVYALCQSRSASHGSESRVDKSRDSRSLILGIPDPTVPFVQEEVEAVAACLPNPAVFVGQSATAERLRQQGPRSQFIHIATHGHFRRDNPMFSGIKLGDSYLSLYDLYQLKLPAELVALSGCSTGLHVVAAGDELLGLARGLLHAGAETSMLTLWDVQDQSTAQLMKSFYTNLARGNSKALALQQAMQQLKSELPHPYYWAPFILVGKA